LPSFHLALCGGGVLWYPAPKWLSLYLKKGLCCAARKGAFTVLVEEFKVPGTKVAFTLPKKRTLLHCKKGGFHSIGGGV